MIQNCCWNIYCHVNWHLTSNFLSLNQKQLCSSRCVCCIHGTVFLLWTHEVQCWTRGTSVVHRASVIEEVLKYPGFTVPHCNIYEWKISLEQFFWWMEKEQKDMIVVEMKFAWNTLNLKLDLSNRSSSHILSVTCQKVQFTLQQIC
jgi:hypothetical protein